MKPSQRLAAVSSALVSLLLALAWCSRVHAISGGTAITDTSYAFIVKLDIGGARSCSGALVAPRWIVSAASCFGSNGKAPPLGPPVQSTTALVGRTDLSQSTGQSIAVVELIPYPSRNLVLAKLAKPVGGIAPVAIGTSAPVVGEELQVAGFGRTASEWVPERLQVATFRVDGVDASTLAIRGAAHENTCKGDAGGPTLRLRGGKLELVAISSSSWQSGCLSETDTRAGATQVRLDDLASWVSAQPSANRRHGTLQWALNGRCLDVLGNTKNKDPVRLWDCQPGSAADIANDPQRWFFSNVEGRFKHRTDDHLSQPSLDLPFGGAPGTQIEIYESNDLDSQKWSLSGGALINGSVDASYGELCLSVPGAQFVVGADLLFETCDGSVAQRFALPGDGTIRPSAAPNLCVDNDANARNDGNPVQLWDCHGGAAQQWDLSRHGLVNEGATDGQFFGCLDRDISRGGGSGSRAQFWGCNSQPNQAFEYLGTVLNKQNYCLDVRGATGERGAAAQGAACTGQAQQLFYYTP